MQYALAKPWSRYALAAGAGLLLAAAFPKIGVAGFAWIAPALLLAAAHGRGGFEAFRIGYVGGLVASLAQYYWLLHIPVSGFPILGWLALSAYLALFPAVWVWLLRTVLQPEAEMPDPADSWGRRNLRALLGAAAWVGLEMVRARLFGGLPWNLLGTSQYQLTPLIQFASFTGVYGVSFLVVWGSLSLSHAAAALGRHPGRRFIWQAEIILPLAAVLAMFFLGSARIREAGAAEAGQPTLRVTFVQPSIPQTMIWDNRESGRRFAQLLELTRVALAGKTDLLIWPEAALPNLGQDELIALTDLVREHGVWLVLGADDVRPHFGATRPDDVDYFNAAVLLNPRGENAGVYHKRKLVMFGEYVPFTRWLPFVKHFTPITGGFTPGDSPMTFSSLVQERGVRFSPLICFEDIFPDLTRGGVDDDTDFLMNLTNNGWFGEGAAQWQHAAAAIFRAVENGIPLLRCSNNGLTCWVDASGRIRQTFRDATGSVYGAGVMTAEIPTLPTGTRRAPTFYHRHGDWFGWACVALSLPRLWSRLPKIRRRR